MPRLFLITLVAACLAIAPRFAVAQAGGFPVKTTARTQFVFKDGVVMHREGNVLTPLTQNVKLSNGVKINYKNGIVEMPADLINPQGKKLTLREGDYVRADGGVVFATPGSAAAARGEAPNGPSGKYTTYVQRGPGYADPAMRASLLAKKVELLTQKVDLLSQGRTDLPNTQEIDAQLAKLETQLSTKP